MAKAKNIVTGKAHLSPKAAESDELKGAYGVRGWVAESLFLGVVEPMKKEKGGKERGGVWGKGGEIKWGFRFERGTMGRRVATLMKEGGGGS